KEYCDLLLKLSQPSALGLMNSFSANPLKERIQMIFTKQSINMKKLLYLLLLPAAGLVGYFSVEVVYAEPKMTKGQIEIEAVNPINLKSVMGSFSKEFEEEEKPQPEQTSLSEIQNSPDKLNLANMIGVTTVDASSMESK